MCVHSYNIHTSVDLSKEALKKQALKLPLNAYGCLSIVEHAMLVWTYMCSLTGFVSSVLERNILSLYQVEGLSTFATLNTPNRYQSFNQTVVLGFFQNAIIFTNTKSDHFRLASWYLSVANWSMYFEMLFFAAQRQAWKLYVSD